jgi:hypothetical protein
MLDMPRCSGLEIARFCTFDKSLSSIHNKILSHTSACKFTSQGQIHLSMQCTLFGYCC